MSSDVKHLQGVEESASTPGLLVAHRSPVLQVVGKSRRKSWAKSPSNGRFRGTCRPLEGTPTTMNTLTSETENWLPVVDYVGYYSISSFGRVRSEERTITYVGKDTVYTRTLPAQILKTPANADGYPTVNLSRDGSGKTVYVHDLVLQSFVGEKPEGLEVCHENDRPADNRLTNLRYGTRSENQHDAVRNGRNVNANKVVCLRNHPFDSANTYVWRGHRSCRECNRINYLARRNQGVAAA